MNSNLTAAMSGGGRFVSAPSRPAVDVPVIPAIYLHPGMSLRQLLSIVYAYRKVTLTIMLASAALTAAVVAMIPKTFVSTAILMVDFDIKDPLSGHEFPTGLMSNYLSTQRDLIDSPAVLLPVVDQLNLTTDPDYISGYRPGSSGLRYWAMEKLQKKIKVTIGEYGSQLLYIAGSAKTADGAARIANTIAHVYVDQQFQRINDPASDRARRYKDQLDQLKAAVDKAQAQVTAYREKSGLVDFDSKLDIETDRLNDLEHRLLEAQEMFRVAKFHAAGDGALSSNALSSTTVQSLKGQLAADEARMAQMRTTLGSRHPDVIALESQIAITRRALDAEIGTYAGSARTDADSAGGLVAELQAAVDQQREKVMHVRQVQDGGQHYVSDLEAAKSLYQRALDGYDQVLLPSTGGYTNVNLVASAAPPNQATKPKRMLDVLMALIVGGIAGLIGPLAYELMHRRVRCADDFERDLGIPVLGEMGRHALPGAVS
jgi:uncharacterized protein involved in exopolysaccharide biosynthesis